MNIIVINFPCKPHIRKFILHIYGVVNDSEPILLTPTSIIGLPLLWAATDEERYFLEQEELDLELVYTARVRFQFPENRAQSFFLTDCNMRRINLFLEGWFRDVTNMEIIREKEKGSNIVAVVQDICTRYNIQEEDLSTDAIHRFSHRHRQKSGHIYQRGTTKKKVA